MLRMIWGHSDAPADSNRCESVPSRSITGEDAAMRCSFQRLLSDFSARGHLPHRGRIPRHTNETVSTRDIAKRGEFDVLDPIFPHVL